ncbi:hypothetical protein Gohar_026808 [Gossypium harknessii]|uniref:Uncharacterized protein n=1 Tax=Gossypium harknessii TaxID=34285 RepID=A0A7J9HSN6_9ROSI|nr:hypothetical protein [Gossypium harknessii]
MRFYTDVETSIGSLYSGYGELLDMPFYLYSDSIDRGNPYRQCKGWLSAILRTRVIITRRRFVKYRTLRTKLTE